MNRICSLAAGVACAATFTLNSAFAQDGPAARFAAEAFTCNYIGDSDLDDVMAAYDDFNEWADEAGLTTLTSLVLVPHFHSEELTADVIYLDLWPGGGEVMGNGVASIMANPDSVSSFDAVTECSAHQLFIMLGLDPPGEGGLGDSYVAQFTDCTVMDNRTPGDGIGAVNALASLSEELGNSDANAVLFPVAGEVGDADYSFKWFSAHPSIQEFGASFDRTITGGGLQRRNNIMQNVMTCNSARVYDTIVGRQAAPAD